MPSPAQFKNRYLTIGGGGWAITSTNSDGSGLPLGLPHGAATGTTDGGFGSWSGQVTDVILAGNGTINQTMVESFAYKSLHESTVLGKELTSNFYGNATFKSYYAGCSEGGREGWSQAQHFGDDFDGLSIGAPAMRQGFQQPVHIWGALAETVLGYVPSSCEISAITTNMTNACDGLDGKVDGVIARSDLCRLNWNANMSIGAPFSCAASSGGSYGGGSGTVTSGGGAGSNPQGVKAKRQMGNFGGGSSVATPAINGTVSQEAATLINRLLDGVVDSKGRQAWIWFQPGAGFGDASGTYNNVTGQYEVASIDGSYEAQWVNFFLEGIDSDVLDISNWTFDTLREVFLKGMRIYESSMQTTWPDLEILNNAGGKIIHWHGEADGSVPTASSVHYQNSVRTVMYPGLSVEDSFAQLDDWYKLFVVPGAGHCSPSAANATFPYDILGQVIEWVEGGVNPSGLNATIQGGDLEGTREDVCAFPTRPQWSSNATLPECVWPEEDAFNVWFPTLDSIPVPVY